MKKLIQTLTLLLTLITLTSSVNAMCYAEARGYNGAVGNGWGYTPYVAESNALAYCLAYSPRCWLVTSYCY